MVIISHFPCLHQGYLKILDKYPQAEILIISNPLNKELTNLENDIRQIPTSILESFFNSINRNFKIINKENLTELVNQDQIVIIADPITQKLLNNHLQGYNNIIIESPLLRQAQENVFTANVDDLKEKEYNFNDKDVQYMKMAYEEAKKSGCWWRQVGSILVKEDNILFKAHNQILPAEDECHFDGCIRDHIKPGEKMDFCYALHSEVSIISQAAKQGVSIDGSNLYVCNYPCPNCAKAISQSGIKKVYFHQGWSNFDAEKILKSANIELIKIELNGR